MAQQHELEPDVELALHWAQEHPEISGGIWFDNEAVRSGGQARLIIASTDPDHGSLRRLLAGCPHPDRLHVRHARLPEARLRSIAQDLCDQQAPSLSGCEADIVRNAVVVYITEPSGELEAALCARYEADALEIRYGRVVNTSV